MDSLFMFSQNGSIAIPTPAMPNNNTTTEPEPRRRLAYLAWRVFRIALLSYFGFILLLKIFENRLVYLPSPWPDDRKIVFPGYMADVNLETYDGEVLHGWHLAHPRPRAHVLFFHGNAGNLSGRQYTFEELHDIAEIDLFAFDYRGYGKSTGRPTEARIIEDARLARKTYASIAGIPESEIVLMGRSLGAGVAVTLAAEDGARGIILQSTFTSLPDVASRQYRWLPVRLLMKNRFDSLARIQRVQSPLLSSHSEDDLTVDFSLGKRLFTAANEPKEFFQFSGRGHNDPQPREYLGVLARFLDSLP